ncbi:hypothetical protein bsdtb5_19110 [Anaeromicropila herbilytica]|uniref:Uncharacterized protein n=1 Tax=Anaeromicropila herbilytica TaxID=2785025 RepID=A0A7R7EL54_9FIRM|nr:hypothetical protein bsdtb5_19110 [Anaeromicropila herbilytica]
MRSLIVCTLRLHDIYVMNLGVLSYITTISAKIVILFYRTIEYRRILECVFRNAK